MIAIVHSIYSQSVHALALNAGLMDNASVISQKVVTRLNCVLSKQPIKSLN